MISLKRLPPVALLVLAGSIAVAANDSKQPARPPLRYGRDIRPLLADRCFKCHGGDAASREANLRLDERESATAEREDGTAIAPGKSGASQVWKRITSDDPDFRMPPPKSNKAPLTADESARIRQWIDDGAEYEPHWAFVKPRRPEAPDVRDKAWPRNDVDRFVLAKLESQRLAPSPEVDKGTLLRRVFLDLTGLPPTPEELDAFAADARPDAVERWIDKILAEEPYRSRYAERMTGPWLDQARYADTSGIHTDAGRQIWPWRDWVLTAYRDNMPFDRFVTEQMAGDLLPNATLTQRVASGFHRNHVTSDEGGAIAEEYLVEYGVDRVATTGAIFLGLTLGCARCHDHKFDPVSQDEFYKLFAFFNSIEEPGLYSQLPDPQRAFEPFIQVPTGEQLAEKSRLQTERGRAELTLTAPVPGEDAQRDAFFADAHSAAGIRWEMPEMVAATSKGGATLTRQQDGSVLVSGTNPAMDEHGFTLRTNATGLRLLSIEALTDPSLPNGRVGRAINGNAVLTGVDVQAVSRSDPAEKMTVPFSWAWADHEQKNGDYRAVNVLNTLDTTGWAVQGHEREGHRALLLLSAAPFGFEGGTELRVKLQYNSGYAQHVLGRVRFSVSSVSETGLTRLPIAQSDWYLAGPFPAKRPKEAFTAAVGPESDVTIDMGRNFGAGNQYWKHLEGLADAALHALPEGLNATYVGRRVFVPSARKTELSLGSDDGIRVFVNGIDVFSKEIDRPLAPNQDKTTVDWKAGLNTIVLKIVNTGGQAGFYYAPMAPESELSGDLVGALLPKSVKILDLPDRVTRSWRVRFSPAYRERVKTLSNLTAQLAKLEAEIPLTMVMKELPAPRETFVLTRGVYNQPDKKRPVTRGVPAALGALPAGAPADRLALSRWLVSTENPLVARVAVNRLWELVFGAGIVRSTEDFGQQGDWPSHPELLDWLAVEFRENGWNVQAILKTLLTSATYRQSSRVRADARERDPENRSLSYYPRKRLTAEQIRDLALAASGLLVSKFGGPSVKPYQPAGLWEEVAMPASNTRIFQRDDGDKLYRRSLYTYWKRACPPPSLMTFDAPTREFCTIRRSSTNTPLQALVLWNDEQFVEAARVLAQRTLDSGEKTRSERERMVEMFRRCTSRVPSDDEVKSLTDTLAAFRERFEAAPADAAKLLSVGAAPIAKKIPAPELAAWTMLANAILSLDATICKS